VQHLLRRLQLPLLPLQLLRRRRRPPVLKSAWRRGRRQSRHRQPAPPRAPAPHTSNSSIKPVRPVMHANCTGAHTQNRALRKQNHAIGDVHIHTHTRTACRVPCVWKPGAKLQWQPQFQLMSAAARTCMLWMPMRAASSDPSDAPSTRSSSSSNSSSSMPSSSYPSPSSWEHIKPTGQATWCNLRSAL
jgi:hypothetical protein